MGLKSKLNKMKSFLFDEEEEVVKKTQKKSVKYEPKKEEIISNTTEIEELYFEDEKEDIIKEPPIKSRTVKNESEFKFPEFNEDDFLTSNIKREPIVQVPKEEKKPLLYQGSKRKEETKKFKPSPIISPIYGLLDKDGNTLKKEVKPYEGNNYKEEPSLETVIKKAYGTYDDLENTMKRLSRKTIEEAEKDMEEEEKGSIKSTHTYEQDAIVISKDDSDDDMLLPNVNFKEIDVDIEKDIKHDNIRIKKKEIKENYEDDEDEDTKEQDLFKLIDSMYQKEGDE